jgi:hypothetical protein
MVATIPLYALALTRPIMDAVAAFHHGTIEGVYADVKGRRGGEVQGLPGTRAPHAARVTNGVAAAQPSPL